MQSVTNLLRHGAISLRVSSARRLGVYNTAAMAGNVMRSVTDYWFHNAGLS